MAVRCLAAAILCGVLSCSACTGDPGPTPDLGAPDLGAQAAASIVATVPSSGAKDVALDTRIEIEFSQPMDLGEVQVSVAPAVDLGEALWNEARTRVSFDPADDLADELSYTVTVVGRDARGLALASPATFSFTTIGRPPRVLSTSPSAGAQGVPTLSRISMVFSEAMDAASVEGSFLCTPALNCAWAWNAETTVATCAPAAPLAADTDYSASLTTAAKDRGGTNLTEGLNFAFRTGSGADTVPPEVLLVDPPNNATGVWPSTKIVVTFSEPMDKAAAQAALTIIVPSGHQAGTFTWNAEGTAMTFDPLVDFKYGDKVSWTITPKATDLAGRPLTASLTSAFSVLRQKSVTLGFDAPLSGRIGLCHHTSPLDIGECVKTLNPRSPPPVIEIETAAVAVTFGLGDLVKDKAAFVNSAVLSVEQIGTQGTPYASLGGKVLAQYVTFSALGDAMTAATFPVCVPLGGCPSAVVLSTSPAQEVKNVAVTAKVRNDLAKHLERGGRSQFRLRFPLDKVSPPGTAQSALHSAMLGSLLLKITYAYP